MSTYTLPELGYPVDALEPHISAKVLELHHGKHHAAYVKGANKALDDLQNARDDSAFEHIGQLEKNLAFNLSGHVLHSRLWSVMSPNAGGRPSGAFDEAISATFGSFDRLQAQLEAVALGVQGSGWAALAWEPFARRMIVQQVYDHQQNVGQGSSPLLVIDVWEHAYYLDHLNDRESWLKAFWNVVDWQSVEDAFEKVSTNSAEVPMNR